MNMTRFCKIWYVSLFILASIGLQAGGGWPQPKGQGYFKLSEWWISADQHYTNFGLKDPNVTSGLYNTNFYGEYGITDHLTVILNMPLLSRSVMNNVVSLTTQEVLSEGSSINTMGDIDLAFKYGILNNGKFALSASVLFGIPSGEDAGGPQRNLQTGDGEFNQMIRLDLGVPLGGNDFFSAYGNIYGGFNNRTKGFSDEYRYGAELGAGILNQKLWLTGRYDRLKSRFNEESGQIDGASFFASNSEFESITGEISYFFTDNFGVSAAIATALSGRIVYAAPSYSFGVFLKV
jgi:hypothetical protein